MPLLKKKTPPPLSWPLVFGAADGNSRRDFYVLAYSPDLDEHEIRQHPLHQQATHILHFSDTGRSLAGRIPERVEDIWAAPSGEIFAVGSPRGILEVTPTGVQEIRLPDVPGTFEAIWGTGTDHLFACGVHAPFLLYRRFGVWHQIPLPAIVGGLRAIDGFHEHDVYIAGDNGQLLHFDGTGIDLLDSPTTRHLTAIVRLNDRHLCVGGYTGTLLMGNRNGWRFVSTGTDDPILSLARLRGNVYFGTPDGLWAFDGRTGPTLAVRQPTRWVNSLTDTLMIVKEDKAWLFDGMTLTPLDTIL